MLLFAAALSSASISPLTALADDNTDNRTQDELVEAVFTCTDRILAYFDTRDLTPYQQSSCSGMLARLAAHTQRYADICAEDGADGFHVATLPLDRLQRRLASCVDAERGIAAIFTTLDATACNFYEVPTYPPVSSSGGQGGSTQYGLYKPGVEYVTSGNRITGSDGSVYYVAGARITTSDGGPHYTVNGYVTTGSDGTRYVRSLNEITGPNGIRCSVTGNRTVCR